MSMLKSLSLKTGVSYAALTTLQKRALTTATETIPKVAPVVPTHVQAFLRDFKSNEPLSIIDLNRKVFGAPLRRDILHRVVVWQRDCMRQGTHSTKGRSEVAGTGKKAAPQKGRGKARVGDMKAPQFRGGGIAFGPKPRDHSTSLPAKVQEMGLRVALSAKYAQDQLTIVDTLQNLESRKTRDLAKIHDETYGNAKMLLIANEDNENLWLAARNIPNLEVIFVEETNVLDLLTYDQVIIEKDAISVLEDALQTV